jgi:hypothetical protein
MLQQLLTMLPREMGSVALIVAIAGAMLGLGLWLIGARYSRTLVTLLAVAAGTLLGKHLPGWFDWPLSSTGAAVGGAMVLGAAAFIGHRLFIGAALGLLLAWWTGIATWALLSNGQSWSWPIIEPGTATLTGFASALWRVLPPDVTRIVPYSGGAALLSGMMIAILWPRIAVVVNWSLAGLSLLLGMGLAAIEHGQPHWLTMLPAQTWAQLSTFAGLVLFGAMVQWWLSPMKPAAAGTKPGEQDLE